MTNDRLEGRLKVLEILTLTSLGLYLANATNDPDYSKAAGVLEYVRSNIANLTSTLSDEGRREAQNYAEELTETLAANLRTLRGEGGPHH